MNPLEDLVDKLHAMGIDADDVYGGGGCQVAKYRYTPEHSVFIRYFSTLELIDSDVHGVKTEQFDFKDPNTAIMYIKNKLGL